MLLYKYLRIERILSLYASLFYPIIETNQITIEIKTEKARNTIKNKNKKNKNKNKNVNVYLYRMSILI